MELNYNLKNNNHKRGTSKGIYFRNNTIVQNLCPKRSDSFDSFLNRNKNNVYTEKPKSINNSVNLKEEINILLHLYFMEKTIASSFPKLNEKDKLSKFYLVDRLWIEAFKKYFDYDNIKNYLVNFDELLINDIISQILMNKTFIDTIKNNKNKDIPHIYKFLTKKVKNTNIKFLIDYEIINDKLYKLFNNSIYLKDKIKKLMFLKLILKKL